MRTTFPRLLRGNNLARRAATVALLIGCPLGSPQPVGAADVPEAELRRHGCGDCHRLDEPGPGERTLAAHEEREGPDLFYAGSKFRPEWLRDWLIEPTAIRPAGLHPARRTEASADGDVVTGEPFVHPGVSAEQVDAVVTALVALDAGSDRLPSDPIKPVAVPRALAELNFVKFKGCGSCHRTDDEGPPLSGPDLQRAYARLRPEYLVSYIAHPEEWDPVAPMPGYGLAPNDVGKLVEYLRLLDEENQDAKTR
jgi:mono/diheme cytochrome c family protein